MTREEKQQGIKTLTELLNASKHIYLANLEGLDAPQTYALRKQCFEAGVGLMMVKNTLLKIALEQGEKEVATDQLGDVLKGNTAVFLSDTGNLPAKLIIKYTADNGVDKPVLKAAYVEESLYIGEDQLTTLSNIKSRDELLGDIVMLLQSPITGVVSAMESSKHKLAGLVQTLSEKK